MSSECLEALYAYRLPEEKKERLQSLLKKYEGQNKFHNFTRRITALDREAERIMYQVVPLEYKVFEGIEFVRIYLKG